MAVKPRPGAHDYCTSCMGWGSYTVHNSTDYEDELECITCGGTGIRTKQKDET
jgi:hypothetical protein